MADNNKTNQNNTSSQKTEIKIEGSKLWLGEDGILYVKIGTAMNEKIAEELANSYIEIAKKLPGQIKALVDMSQVSHTSLGVSSEFRKKIVENIKEAFKKYGFKKAAIWGGGIMQRTVVRFILAAARIENIRFFKTEEEALKWLNKV